MADTIEHGRRVETLGAHRSIRLVGGVTMAPGGSIRAAAPAPSRCERDLIETLLEWGVEPWEIALATSHSEAVVDAVANEGGAGRPSAKQQRMPWADDFLIFLHARMTDLPNWWERTGAPGIAATGVPPPRTPQKKRARAMRAL